MGRRDYCFVCGKDEFDGNVNALPQAISHCVSDDATHLSTGYISDVL